MDAVAHLPDVHKGIAVDDEAHLVVCIDVEDNCFVLRGDEGGIVTGGKVLKVDSWCEDGIAAVAQHNGGGEVDGGGWSTVHLYIIIIGGLHALTAERCLQFCKAAFEHLVARQVATADIPCLRGYLLNTFEGCDGAGGKAGVVAPLHNGIDGIGAHYHYLVLRLTRIRRQRENAIVFEQDDALAGHIEGQLFVSITGDNTFGNLCPGVQIVRVKVSEFEAGDEQSAQALVEV